MSKTDVTNIIEKLEAFEERLGITLNGISAFYEQDDYSEDDSVEVMGEILARSGEKIEESLNLVLAVYDKQGRVIGKDSIWFDNDDFFVLDTFSVSAYVPKNSEFSKIRIYPKKA